MFAPLKWFILSLQFATVIPMPNVQDVTEKDMQRSVIWFPVIGLGLGFILFFLQHILSLCMPHLPATVLALSLYTLMTGALHLDGLMDTADAIGSRRPRDSALEIMKDSRVGAMGVIAAVLAVLGKVTALSSLSPDHVAPFILVPMMGRMGMVWSMVLAPSARSEGLGALFARKIPWWTVGSATFLCFVICLSVGSFQACIISFLYALVTTVAFTTWMKHRFGGTTGDTYGALNEIMECVGWYVLLSVGF